MVYATHLLWWFMIGFTTLHPNPRLSSEFSKWNNQLVHEPIELPNLSIDTILTSQQEKHTSPSFWRVGKLRHTPNQCWVLFPQTLGYPRNPRDDHHVPYHNKETVGISWAAVSIQAADWDLKFPSESKLVLTQVLLPQGGWASWCASGTPKKMIALLAQFCVQKSFMNWYTLCYNVWQFAKFNINHF